MLQQVEHLTIATLADKFGEPNHIVAGLFQDTLNGLSKSKTVREHLNTNAAMPKLRRTIKRLRKQIDGDDDVTLGDIATATGLPVEYVTTYFAVSMQGRGMPLTRVPEAS
ncbi:hypothetical protein [Bradyrhizobium cytisi]|uniref:Uncharacterized protein n=1 Tax=Bradyrhizobium cytisi TaxID=515489 RepID=A0A5S4WWH5_9BRAD|nr:hypothetical protein [Bradyrhizobium cytisi]TYL86342.1 hypothetical protein FXB38_07645 [Bradyrhizobium cytisi]